MASRKDRFLACLMVLGNEFQKMSPSHFDCNFNDIKLFEFLADGPKTMREIAEILSLTPGTVTSKIDKYIRMKLVVRRYDVDDRRKVLILLSKKGQKLVEDIVGNKRVLMDAVLKKLKPAEQEQLVGLFEKMVLPE